MFVVFHAFQEIFTLMETSALQVNIYARCSWTMNFEDSLASHSYCDTSSDFKVTPRRPVTFTPSAKHLAVKQSVLPVLRLRSVRSGIRAPNLLHVRQML